MARWLIIGGTRFVGHHIAQAALDAGHAVTLFHRGHTPARLEGPYREVHGDRDGGMDRLHGSHWDAVIDVCGYLPRVVEQALEALECEHYTFISTVSVYPERPVDQPPIREDDPLLPWRGPRTEAITEQSYGPLKVECERAVVLRHPGATIIRPGYVVGPRDHTHRFSWWVHWLAQGGPVLVPANQDAPIQVIDGRDLAAFVVRATEQRLAGAFNCVGPAAPTTWGEVYGLIARHSDPPTALVPVDEAWLVARGIDEDALPMWLPADRLGESLVASVAKATAAGLRLRPLVASVRDILAEPPRADRPAERLDGARAARLLERWAREG
jgi:2'-hydroxyisoflavone reductase